MSKLNSKYKKAINGKIIFVTGGTGSFGKRFIKTLLKNYNPKKIILYSRDELKQYNLQNDPFFKKYEKKLRYFIGDIRDKERLDFAISNNSIEIIVHAAALKQVVAAEYNPFETIKTNIIGAQNIVECSLKHKVKKVLALSTDKAAAPINLYGATKLASDKIFVSANNFNKKKTFFSVVRYGNVFGSRGSVIFNFLKNKDIIPITDKKMTRFSISLQEGIDFVIKSLYEMWGGEIFIPKIQSYNILDLAKAVNPKAKYKILGIRSGEKIHEEMLTKSDSYNSLENDDHYVILPSFDFLSWDKKKYVKQKKLNYRSCKPHSYSSDNNKFFLSINELKKLIKKLQISKKSN
jgi:UDP-N-acetylglucosamine 4,6-dehydratase (inverting)